MYARNLLYSWKISREKSFVSFVASYLQSFLHEIWGYGVLWRGKSEQSVKVLSVKSYFSPICESFPTMQCFDYC